MRHVLRPLPIASGSFTFPPAGACGVPLGSKEHCIKQPYIILRWSVGRTNGGGLRYLCACTIPIL